eukprot:78376-Chlamydomonas_euryale.AAC.10
MSQMRTSPYNEATHTGALRYLQLTVVGSESAGGRAESDLSASVQVRALRRALAPRACRTSSVQVRAFRCALAPRACRTSRVQVRALRCALRPPGWVVRDLYMGWFFPPDISIRWNPKRVLSKHCFVGEFAAAVFACMAVVAAAAAAAAAATAAQQPPSPLP